MFYLVLEIFRAPPLILPLITYLTLYLYLSSYETQTELEFLLSSNSSSHLPPSSLFNLTFDRQKTILNELNSLKNPNGYTIICNSFRRNDFLFQSIKHYSQCPGLHSYRISWSDLINPPPYSELDEISNKYKVKIIVDTYDQNSLNNRFSPLNNLTTDAVLSIDDDVFIQCLDIEFGFGVWRDYPNTIVGYFPRPVSRYSNNGYHYWSYNYLQKVKRTGHYIILTKFSFFHQAWLKVYTEYLPSEMKEFIDKNKNCEDIAFSFFVAHFTKRGGQWVQAASYDKGKIGISAGTHHNQVRDQCLHLFVKHFSYFPLIPSGSIFTRPLPEYIP